jgi:hypothetical protein
MTVFAKRCGTVAVLAATFVAGYALAAQPHMEAAMHALENARDELKSADTDKAGHRAKAIELVNSAIEQTRLGMEAAH